jgi:lysophospholipase L1-like esterase
MFHRQSLRYRKIMRKVALPCLIALITAALPQASPQSALPRIRIILVGDSTMALKSGWGPGFCADVVEQVDCVNMAKGGRSSGSYRAEGSWAKVMDELKRNSNYTSTYVLIQFGHNDQPGKPGRSTDLATEFPANLHLYVDEVQSSGAKPVLITPLTRRSFKAGALTNNLEPWAAATTAVAAEKGVPLLELNADSVSAVQSMVLLKPTRWRWRRLPPPSRKPQQAATRPRFRRAPPAALQRSITLIWARRDRPFSPAWSPQS